MAFDYLQSVYFCYAEMNQVMYIILILLTNELELLRLISNFISLKQLLLSFECFLKTRIIIMGAYPFNAYENQIIFVVNWKGVSSF